MKKCTKCNLEKELNYMVKNKRNKDGYTSICKVCDSLIKKNYREKNKEYTKIYNKKYKEENKEYFKEYFKKYSKNESYKEYQEEYRNKNREYFTEYNKEYYLKNADSIKNSVNLYRINNKDKINANIKLRCKNDTIFALKRTISKSILKSIKSFSNYKSSKTTEILGCSVKELKLYLESKFDSWMTWDNRGLYNGELNYGWDIDHIIPLSSAKSEEEVIKLNHYTNLQPLCSKINRDIKKDKMSEV